VTYAAELIEEETAYLAYHLHWELDSIQDLEHADRRGYVRRVAALVERAEGER
jgi:hypothetical protein